ncbi:MAG: phosphatase PAP2 family protein, partial [Chitinophagaceae bacterium]|nr:phosphatase PAP2 family protein [Chitinophagaceae bacterium]
KERYGPLMASMLFYFWVFWVFHKQFKAPLEIQGLLFAIFLSNVLVFMATIFYKISMHTAGWATAVVLLAYWTMKDTATFPLLLLAVVLAGMVGSIRFYVQAHSPKQIYVGYVIGAIAALLAILIVPLIP